MLFSMYNPSRGGVRGGADQFTWESVKSDKHRENYLGHSLMAPVGRWQKGKDLSWYARERKESDALENNEKTELASIKRAEEEAMLIALGHNIVRKTQTLTKEDMREALKRNIGEKDDHHIERIDGVGAASSRIALLSGVGKDARQKSEGVAFETHRERNTSITDKTDKEEDSVNKERKKMKKKSKKHKKEKKHKKHHKETFNPDSSDGISKYKSKHKKDESDSDGKKFPKVETHKRSKNKYVGHASESDLSDTSSKHKTKPKKSDYGSDGKKSSKVKSHKKSNHRHKDYSDDDSDEKYQSNSQRTDHKRHKKQNESVKRCRHDTSESD